MSYRVPVARAPSSAGTSSESDSDERCSDWASSLGDARQTQSLFDHTVLPTPEAALEHDKSVHGFDLLRFVEDKGLDVYGRMRLINHIRKTSLSSKAAASLSGKEDLFKDDELLIPVLADDPLLQLDFDDSWSDDGDLAEVAGSSLEVGDGRVQALASELEDARRQIAHLQTLVHDVVTVDTEDGPVQSVGKGKGKLGRDDDTHYFDSYAENDIHEIMLKDTTRTVSYARFILSNPDVFKGAVVMDVGCGTGILSMFAARAGAKHVYAIEASELASKARENIRRNGLDKVITVIQGKVEDIQLPGVSVDVIMSEWMGYMLLYESMLDSVLVARDRFLSPGGLMAPSHTRLVISGIVGERIWNERIEFWEKVYGFDMTTMSSVYFDEGLVEVVGAGEVMTSECILRDIDSHVATPKSLDFHTTFSLAAASTETQTIRAFLTHFDTFFFPTRATLSRDEKVDLLRFDDDEYKRPVEPKSDSGLVSFTTGPRGKETHWRQVAFLLREPITLLPGQCIVGKFYCRKSADNSRELAVEIHYAVVLGRDGAEAELPHDGVLTVQLYKVR